MSSFINIRFNLRMRYQSDMSRKIQFILPTDLKYTSQARRAILVSFLFDKYCYEQSYNG